MTEVPFKNLTIGGFRGLRELELVTGEDDVALVRVLTRLGVPSLRQGDGRSVGR